MTWLRDPVIRKRPRPPGTFAVELAALWLIMAVWIAFGSLAYEPSVGNGWVATAWIVVPVLVWQPCVYWYRSRLADEAGVETPLGGAEGIPPVMVMPSLWQNTSLARQQDIRRTRTYTVAWRVSFGVATGLILLGSLLSQWWMVALVVTATALLVGDRWRFAPRGRRDA